MIRLRPVRGAAVVAAAAVLLVAAPRSAGADQPSFKQAQFSDQAAKATRLTAATQMTKDVAAPVLAFTGPTDMLVSPTNPRRHRRRHRRSSHPGVPAGALRRWG